jgi:hypothetical protein
VLIGSTLRASHLVWPYKRCRNHAILRIPLQATVQNGMSGEYNPFVVVAGEHQEPDADAVLQYLSCPPLYASAWPFDKLSGTGWTSWLPHGRETVLPGGKNLRTSGRLSAAKAP